MYEITSKPLVSRTLATLRSAELGFFGVVVYTFVHTPRRCGDPLSAGLLLFTRAISRGLRTSWLMVGMFRFPCLVRPRARATASRANPPISHHCEAFDSSRCRPRGSTRELDPRSAVDRLHHR